jgi:hypothetical protein
MLDVKRDHFTMRPHLGRLDFVVADPEPLMPALVTLGFAPLEQPVVVGDVAFHLAALDFGPESIDGWLANSRPPSSDPLRDLLRGDRRPPG